MSVEDFAEALKRQRHETWREPEPLPQGPPPVEPFHLEMVPAAFADWVGDITDRMQVPADYVAVAAMVAAGALIGRQIGIRPKRHDDWLVVPNLWGVVVGRPGLLKTPALEETLRPIKALERDAAARHAEQVKVHEAQGEIDREAKKLRAGRIREELKSHRDRDNLARELAGEQGEISEPARQRFIANDATVPKLGELLRDNPRGVLVFRDELMGWLRSLETEGREGDRGFYLEAWNGTGRFTYDRIGRGTVDIEAACVSVLGGIQPGPLLGYLAAKAWDGAGDDGLLQRFQLAVWPDAPPTWRNVDRAPNSAARAGAAAIFARLTTIATPADEIPALRFDSEAQGAFDAWRTALETRLRDGSLHPAFEAHIAKYRSLLPSIALVCHLVDGAPGERVGVREFYRAEAWAEYLESHAGRIYAALLRADHAAARALGERITDGALPSPFRLRDVYRPQWSGLTTRQAATEAVELLCDLGWLRAGKVTTGGRDATEYGINPAVRRPA